MTDRTSNERVQTRDDLLSLVDQLEYAIRVSCHDLATSHNKQDAREASNALRIAIAKLCLPDETSELRSVPTAWVRGVKDADTPNGPGEWNADFSYGDDRPDGDGWVPLYSKPPHIRPAVEPKDLRWALDRGDELADWINRARPVITELMAAYERRIRSDCNGPEQLAKEPWRCAEYICAERLLADQPKAVVEIRPEEPAAEQPKDYAEVVLRVEIASDTDQKVETFRQQLCDAILAAPAALRADVMVTIHREGQLSVFETNRTPVKAKGQLVDSVTLEYK